MNTDGKSRDNCFLILELPYDAPGLTDEEIAKAIDTKRKFWSKPTHKKNAVIYEDYKNNLKYIQSVMLDPAKRKKEAQLAKEYVDSVLPPRMSLYAQLDNISETEMVNIQDDTGVSKVYLEKLIPQRFHLQIIGKDPAPLPPVEDPNPKPECADTYKKSVDQLRELGFEDMYEFLRKEGDQANLKTMKLEVLRSRITEMEATFRTAARDSALTNRQNLCKLAIKAFADEASRDEYNQFVIWYKTDKIIKSIKSVAGANQNRIIGAAADNYLKQLASVRNGSMKRAQQILEAVGKREGILISASLDVKKTKSCPNCGFIFEVEDGSRTKVCPHCGAALTIRCRKCGTENESAAEFCIQCGTSFKELARLLSECSYAMGCIGRADLAQARLILQEVEAAWPGLEDAKKVREELKKKEAVLQKPLDDLKKSMSQREYYKALQQVQDIKQRYPGFRIQEEASIQTAIATADQTWKKMEQAEKSGSADRVIQYCEDIFALCADYPGVQEKMRLYPPAAASDVTVEADRRDGSNRISWKPSSSKGNLIYTVVRKEGAVSNSVSDGVKVGETGGSQLRDMKASPGVLYYYTVFVMRSGVSSRGASVRDGVANLSELKIKNVEAGDGSIRITWQNTASNVKVKAWRKKKGVPSRAGDGEEVRCTLSGILDDDLENEVKYGYRLCAEYNMNGKTVMTEGVTVQATPIAMPEPADDLRISFVQGDSFEAVWKDPKDGGKVSLYYSENSVDYDYGEMVSVTEIEKTLTRLQMTASQPGSCRFNLPGTGFYTVVAVNQRYDTAVIGEKAFATKAKGVDIDEVKVVGKDLYILGKWPKDARAVIIMYQSSGYTTDTSDRKAARIYVTKRAYDRKGALVIPDYEKKPYYISLFAELNVNGEITYSLPTMSHFEEQEKVNITFMIKKPGFLGREAVVTFQSDKDSFTLPDIEIYGAQNSAPMFKEKGQKILEVPGQKVKGKHEVRIPVKSLKKQFAIRPFFKDDSLYEGNSLKPAAGTEYIIS